MSTGAGGSSNMFIIAERLQNLIQDLVDDFGDSLTHSNRDGISRRAERPYVRLRRRRASRGREDGRMRVEEGITIVPMKPVKAMGTNERDGVGYRFLVALASGTLTDEITDNWPLPIWEQAIRRRFNNNRMGSLSLNFACEVRTTVDPGELPDWAFLEDSVEATFLVVTEYVRENRIE